MGHDNRLHIHLHTPFIIIFKNLQFNTIYIGQFFPEKMCHVVSTQTAFGSDPSNQTFLKNIFIFLSGHFVCSRFEKKH